jgi:hypothetical protein
MEIPYFSLKEVLPLFWGAKVGGRFLACDQASARLDVKPVLQTLKTPIPSAVSSDSRGHRWLSY